MSLTPPLAAIRSPLGWRLFLSILLFSSLITLTFTGLQLYHDYQLELATIDSGLEQEVSSYLDGIARGVDAADENQIMKSLEALKRHPYIDHVGVSQGGELKWSAGEAVVSHVRVRHFPLVHPLQGTAVITGQLEVSGSLDTVYQGLLDRLLLTLLSNALKTALMAVIILALFHQFVGRHIFTLTRFIRRVGTEDNLPRFELARTPASGRRVDELDALAEATNQMVASLQTRESDLRVLATTVEQNPNSIILTDTEGRIEYINSKLSEMSGYTLAEVKGKNPRLFSAGQTPQRIYRELWQTIEAGKTWTGELYNRKKSGECYWECVRVAPVQDSSGSILHYIAIKEDISLRKSYEEQLLRQANFDSLTNLPNRLLAFDRISQALISHHRDDGHVVIMFIDLDRFKNINDTWGHGCGDQLLISASRRLKQVMRIEDTVARFGGDEFVVVLPNIIHSRDIEIIAEKIAATMTKPFLLEQQEVYVTASIGITVYPEDGDSPQVLLRNADSAMYRAKEDGRNGYCFFTQSMNEQAKLRMEMESALRQALEKNEFSLHLQPIIDAHSRNVVVVEALLRWHHPVLGTVPPTTFIPLAEDIGLILPIGAWVLVTACKAAAVWQHTGSPPLRVAVNVSARQFQSGRIIDSVIQALAESMLPPHCLEIEITEGILLDDAPEVHAMLSELHRMGVRLSIDDFGTGYSALSYLQKFPFQTLKIDRSFVRDVITNEGDAALVTAIINMAEGLKLEVIGEGVETVDQLNYLRQQGVHMVQGFLFSKAVPVDEFDHFLNYREQPLALVAEQESPSYR